MIQGLKDKVVIVTGGGHGIGRAYCHGFAEAGAKVVVADIDAPAAEKVAGEVVKQFDGKALAAKVDVANEQSTKEWAVDTRQVQLHRRLVNNAAIFSTIPMNCRVSTPPIRRNGSGMMTVNSKVCFCTASSCRCANKTGKIINIPSGTARRTAPAHPLRHRKGALSVSPHPGARREDNINVNAIAPARPVGRSHRRVLKCAARASARPGL
jgi:3-oxoacyl-[acyl-carrier protein] reductase